MKTKMTRRCKLAMSAALLSGGLFHYASAYAALLDIANVPLFIGSVGVPPNVFVTLDDSGSMDWEFTTSKHWQANFYDRDIGNSSSTPTDTFPGSEKRWYGLGSDLGDAGYGQGTTSILFSYYYDNSDNIYGVGCESGNGNGRTINSCNPNFTLFRPKHANILWDWRIYSSDLNVLYYDPDSTYEPWEAVGTGDASYTNACSNPVWGANICRFPRDLSTTDFRYAVWTDDKGFNAANSVPNRGTSIDMTNESNGYLDLWDTYTLYTVKAGNAHQIDVQTFQTTNCENTLLATTPPRTNDARCYDGATYQRGRLLVDQVGATITLSGVGPHPELGGRTIPQVKQNIANWYQYSRKRSFVAKGALGKVITTFPNFRYGVSVLNQWNGAWPTRLFVQMPAAAQPPYDVHNTDLLQKMYGFQWTGSSTPLQAALDRSGQYFKNDLAPAKPTPILPAGAGGECQQNFSLLTSDGFWNIAYGAMGNKDGDGQSNTLADVAHHYYKTDLSPLPDKVITTPFDYAQWQHMVTFTVGFGVDGFFNYPTASGWPTEVDPLSESGNWGNPNASATTPAKIDDMWHAAYNGRGAFISARNPDELVAGLSQALSSIQSRVGSGSALSLNAGFVTDSTSTTAYLARFNSLDWTGQLLAVEIAGDGSFNLAAPLWDTGEPASPFAITAPGARKIFTRSGGVGVEFLWGNLDPAQQAALNTHPLLGPDGKGPQRLEFLRGKGVAPADSAWLAANDFRERTSMLGDIIHSDPFFMDGNPPVVYVGANDGMLHAFHANTGQELFAYVPSAVFKRLSALPEKDYAHQFTVDGSAVVRNIGNKKILIGTLRGGGQSVFALDVTDPANFNAGKVLWEYSDNDLGYTFSKPTIARLANGEWAVFIGNGYNNTEADGSASATGNAVLYVLNAETGALIKKFDTGKGLATATDGKPNGLATPGVTFDPDNPSEIKYVYAGDLQGNLWKFDVSAANPATWNIAYSNVGCAASNTCKPLFTAKNAANQVQPITIQPNVNVHPFRGYLVYFGTGKYFETTDNSSAGQPTQTLYAIWDRAWGEVAGDPAPGALLPQTRAHLLQQEILDNPGGFYVTSEEPITWHPALNTNSDPTGNPPTHLGWYVDLIVNGNNQGEKQVTNGLLWDDKIFFSTTIPSADLCDAGGSSNLIVLDAFSGSRLSVSPFNGVGEVTGDFDNDGVDETVPVSSLPSTVGILSSPRIIENLRTGENYVAVSGSLGRIQTCVGPNCPPCPPGEECLQEIDVSRPAGRQSWLKLQQQ